MIGNRATTLPLLLAAAALFAGCKNEVTNEESTSTDPTVDWTVDGGSDGASDTGGDTGGAAATAEEGPEADGPTVVIVGGEAAAR